VLEIMAYFRNSSINLLNLHYALHALALSGGGAFYGVFLLKAGVSAPLVLASLSLVNVLRFSLRPLVLAPVRRFGLKPVVFAGVLLCTLQYPLLAHVHCADGLLLVLIVVSAVGDTVYWTPYHAFYALSGEAAERGRQLGLREGMAALAGVVAPLATGWALATYGPNVAFYATAAVVFVAALPILGTENVRIAASAPQAFRAALRGAAVFAADGWRYGAGVVWSIALFLSLGESFTGYGGAVALAAIVGAASGLALGRFLDLGHGRRVVWGVSALLAIVDVMRAGSYGSPALAVAANAAAALAGALYMPTLMTAIYNLAKDSPCALRFQIAADGGWDAGAAGACLTAAAMLALGAPMPLAILLSLPATAALFWLLRGYYAKAGTAQASETAGA
jgi:MFS transporter, DHA1 family, inner membrane transport protein